VAGEVMKELFHLRREADPAGEEIQIASRVSCLPLEGSTNGMLVDVGKGSAIRVVVMSDIHSKEAIYSGDEEVTQTLFPTLPIGDILIIAGDFTQSGQLEEYQHFNSFLRALVHREIYDHIVIIAGNHERTLDSDYYQAEGWRYDKNPQDPVACRNALFYELPSNIHYLLDSSVIIQGLVIYGSPWVIGGDTFSSDTSPAHYRWGYSLPESALDEKWQLIPPSVDILVTHQPPFGAGDLRRNYDLDAIVDDRQIFGFDNKGSVSLAREMRQRQPILHVCGHEHNGYGVYSYADCSTLIMNAAVCDEDYSPSNPLLVVDIESPRRIVESPNSTTDGSEETRHVFSPCGLDFYISVLLSLKSHSITLPENQQEVMNIFLRLLTSPLHETLPRTLFPHEITDPPKSTSLFSSIFRLFKSSEDHLEIAFLVAKYQNLILEILDGYSLTSGLYFYRRLTKSADLDSSHDFRSMQLVVPSIYLGSEYPADDVSYLRRMGITHIINCAGTPPGFPSEFSYHLVVVADSAEEDIAQHFSAAIQFIDSALQSPDGKVFIHCQLGLSRSPSIVIAYLMRSMNISFSIAHSIVKRARGFISINHGFIRQLMEVDQANLREDKLCPFFEVR
jgi:Icc-related predicted phosphoesterase